MTGPVSCAATTIWVPPIDYVLEVYGDVTPAEVYDGTVWIQLKDCVLVASGDTYEAGTTGGSNTIALTTSELPNHTHNGSTSSDGFHSHTVSAMVVSYWQGDTDCVNTTGGRVKSTTTSSAGAHTHTVTIGATGGGKAFSLMNPYVAVNVWQRIG